MDIDKYTPIEIKKLFTKGTNINFLNDYTFQDVEDGKKKLYNTLLKDYPTKKEQLKEFLNEAGRKLMEDKMSNGFDKPIGAVIKNTVKDNLNPDYKNTIKRLINIDSQYIPINATNYVFKLSEKLVNVVSLELINLQIPVSIYNIEDRQGNNFFIITITTTGTPVDHIITIEDGCYTTDTLITSINNKLISNSIDVSFSINPINGKTVINGSSIIIFYEDNLDEKIKINNTLGWMLGFRNYTVDASENPVSAYTIINTTTSEKVAYINNTKNITIVVNDFVQNQTSSTMVQTINDFNTIKPSSYIYKNDNYKELNLDCINCSNLPTYMANNGGLTKAQLYSRSQINQNKVIANHQNNYLEPNTSNDVLAIVPFESSTVRWGHKYFTDKNEYKREYHGPVEIEKLQIKLYDDKGYEMDFNGSNWSMTLITEHLYKY
uniref:Uncharacterized protein n=1 Tax=viral metagenome TaxID=1070528 RepID=A0A6C0EUG1_9ZZZZ